MRPLPDLVPIEQLDREILNICTRINVATYDLLMLVREFDERAGWLNWGLDNCADWLAWRCDMSLNTAREKVRVAHALKSLPKISASFSIGELSYSKVRELTRVADANSESPLLQFALRHTASTVADRCRELRFGRADSLNTAARAHAGRSLRVRRDADRGVTVVTVELPIAEGGLLEKALDKARDDEVLEIPDLANASWSTRQADAFVTIVNHYLSGNAGDGPSDNYVVSVHVDQAALAGSTGRSALPIESVKRICCDSHAVVITENDEGEVLNIGRKSRIVPTAIQRAVRARDNDRCTFPGCRNRRFLHCHHVEHWSNGGDTSLDNLMLLCTKHHTLVHEGGFRIERDFNHDWYFVRPDGIAVPPSGYHLRDVVDTETGEIHPDGGYAPAGAFFSAAERSASEPPPPRYLH